jgi:hypothetical protein
MKNAEWPNASAMPCSKSSAGLPIVITDLLVGRGLFQEHSRLGVILACDRNARQIQKRVAEKPIGLQLVCQRQAFLEDRFGGRQVALVQR